MSNEDIESGLIFDQIAHYDGNTPVVYHNEDMLSVIYGLQKKLMDRYLKENLDIESDIELDNFYTNEILDPNSGIYTDIYTGIKENFLTDTANFIAEEAFELKRHFNYKSWKNWKQPNLEKAKEELIDIFHFVLQAAILLGMEPEDIVAAFIDKNRINHERQSGDY